MKHNKRIVLDFDDTLAYTKNRDWENAIPNEALIQKCNQLFDSGWTIDIFTARGSISCKTRIEAEQKYGQQIRSWLSKHNVKYNELSFDKPLAAYYIDDKGISPELFLEADIKQLCGGLSGSDIYTDGNLVHKTADNGHEAMSWFDSAKEFLNVPRIDRIVGNTLTMEYINHNEQYFSDNIFIALAKIQEVLTAMSKRPSLNEKVFDDYAARIKEHCELANLKLFDKVHNMLYNGKQYKSNFAHGDFGIKNLLFSDERLVLIDPIPNVFGCVELDVAKFLASLLINKYTKEEYDTSFELLSFYNKIDKNDLRILVASECIRVFKYHPDKVFVLTCVNSIIQEI